MSFNKYFELDKIANPKDSVEESWEMLEFLIKAIIINSGKIVPGADRDPRKEKLLRLFTDLCSEHKVFLDYLGFIKFARHMRNRVVHEGFTVDDTTASNIKGLAKRAFEEVLEKFCKVI